MKLKIAFAVVATFAIFVGCDSSDHEGDLLARVVGVTDASTSVVELELVNGTEATVTFMSCCSDVGYHVERYENDGWSRIGSRQLECPSMGDGVVVACESEPLTLEPGKSYFTEATISETGLHRLIIPYGWSRSKNNDAYITTDRFEVE